MRIIDHYHRLASVPTQPHHPARNRLHGLQLVEYSAPRHSEQSQRAGSSQQVGGIELPKQAGVKVVRTPRTVDPDRHAVHVHGQDLRLQFGVAVQAKSQQLHSPVQF